VLEDVIKEHPVLLNRAPTLHRLGIQAFEPVLTEGRALKLHPLACTAYNADFDGDQMAIHLPLSAEAQTEARILMLAANHILAPKDGKPIIVPTQDMVLGSYYLTILKPGALGEGKVVTGIAEALLAYQQHELAIQAEIRCRMVTPDGNTNLVKTSLGRMIFNEILPPELRHFQQDEDGTWSLGKLMKKKQIGALVADCYNHFGATKTAEIIDGVKNLGYHYACIAGMTVAISDVIVPPEKKTILENSQKLVNKVERQFGRGLVTEEERYNKVVALWSKATEDVADAMMANMDAFNPIFMMADSGARGNRQQMRQLAGMRGLMADPSGKIIEVPITANFREGLSVSDYFISSHGARKGLADTALRTADSGYLTRRLVDVAQDVIVREEDCDVSTLSLVLQRAAIAENTMDALEILNDTLLGRLLAADVVDPKTNEVLFEKDTVLGDEELMTIGEHEVPELMVRGSSVVTAASVSSAMVSEVIKLGTPDEEERKKAHDTMIHEMLGKEVTKDVVDSDGNVVMKAHEHIDAENFERVLASDAKALHVRNNNVRGIEVEAIKEGDGIIESLEERIVGRVLAEDIVDPATGEKIASLNDTVDEALAKKIAAVRDKVSIRSVLTCKSQFGVCIKCYGRDLANQAEVEVGEAVGVIAAQSIGEPGTQLTMRTFHSGGVAGGDITQGLPRVEELFEARKPKGHAIIAEIEGTAEVEDSGKGMRKVTIHPSEGDSREYAIPFGARMAVRDGQHLMPGDRLTEGSINPHDILRVCGLQATQRYLVYEVQKVYKTQGVEINDKHIEVMVRQMLRKVKIEESGSTDFLPGEYIDINQFEAANTKAIEEGGEPAVAKPILLGITKASLATDSFLSAASFQETTRVLTDAAIKGKVDPLVGLKENVIIGKLIPAGTGMSRYHDLEVVKVGEEDKPLEAPSAEEEVPEPADV
uniref:DNA-directed RNA polymerase subunit beta' n=1 Tax=uncultured Selenomonas sp. TaxID=159275 RepID=UPI0025E4ACD8